MQPLLWPNFRTEVFDLLGDTRFRTIRELGQGTGGEGTGDRELGQGTGNLGRELGADGELGGGNWDRELGQGIGERA